MTLERLIILEREGRAELLRQLQAREDTRETRSTLVVLRKMIRRRYREQTVDERTGRLAA